MAKVTTLQEIDTHYTLQELYELNEALDVRDDIERKSLEAAKRRRGG
ncbi:MAG: hypothetical protein GTO64_09305 [Candidatus Latescibacteria bacterium]|nr:hypothetical protein [Candidatus Latescibacterota bacterium]